MNNKKHSLAGRRVLVTGSTGFIGRSLTPLLAARGARLICPTRRDYDLLDQGQVRKLFAAERPEVVFHLAGLVGGILANKRYPADFASQNLLMGTLMMDEAHRAGITRYVTLIGGCSYPASAPNPIEEEALWEGYPQPESAAYSLAKRMMLVLAQAYRAQHGLSAIVLVPGNVYGPHDNFDLEASHVIPALIRKYHEAAQRGDTEVVAWGTGRPVRDFVYVADACEAIAIAAESYDRPEIVNISSGQPVTIRELVETTAQVCGFEGRVVWDATKPDGQMLKGFDVSRMKDWLGYQPPTSLRDGLVLTRDWYAANVATARLGEASPAT